MTTLNISYERTFQILYSVMCCVFSAMYIKATYNGCNVMYIHCLVIKSQGYYTPTISGVGMFLGLGGRAYSH